jgi:hypothetical protein
LVPVGSGYGTEAGSCEYDDEPSGFGATDLVTYEGYLQFKIKY